MNDTMKIMVIEQILADYWDGDRVNRERDINGIIAAISSVVNITKGESK